MKTSIKNASVIANKVTNLLKSEKALQDGSARNAVLQADSALIDKGCGLSELEYVDVWTALKALNQMCKAVHLKGEVYSDGCEITTSSAAPAKSLVRLMELLGKKIWKAQDLLFFPEGNNSEVLYKAESLNSLRFFSQWTEDAVLCEVKRVSAGSELCEDEDGNLEFQGKYVYVAVPLGKDGKVRIKDVAKSIFARYAEEIKEYNKELKKALNKAKKQAVETENKGRIFVGSAEKYAKARANYEHTQIERELTETFKDVQVEKVAPEYDVQALALSEEIQALKEVSFGEIIEGFKNDFTKVNGTKAENTHAAKTAKAEMTEKVAKTA